MEPAQAALYKKVEKEHNTMMTRAIFSGLAVELINTVDKATQHEFFYSVPLAMIGWILIGLVVVGFIMSEKGSVERNKRAMKLLHTFKVCLVFALLVRFGGEVIRVAGWFFTPKV